MLHAARRVVISPSAVESVRHFMCYQSTNATQVPCNWARAAVEWRPKKGCRQNHAVPFDIIVGVDIMRMHRPPRVPRRLS